MRNINPQRAMENYDKMNISEDFKSCYEKYFTVIFKHAAYLTGNVQIAEDIAQETFIRLYNTPPQHSNVGAWLSRVASNMAYNYLRDEKIRRNKEPVVEDSDESKVISIEDVVIKDSEIRLTRKILNTMKARDKMCLLLKFSGYKYNEISEILDIEKNSVGKILARAQEKFRELYLREV